MVCQLGKFGISTPAIKLVKN